MKAEFTYSDGNVFLERDSHESARKAEWAAQRSGLIIRLFSYAEILEQVGEGQDPIDVCSQVTGTQYEEQVKALFVSDAPLDGQHRPNSAIAVLRYPDRLDNKKLGEIIWSNRYVGRRKDMVMGKLARNLPGLEALGIVPGYLGINPHPIYVPEFVTAGPGETFDPYTDKYSSMHVIDESLRELSRFCMLAGFKKADALVVIGGHNGRLGDKLDTFLNAYFGGSKFVITDIKEKRK